MGHDYSERRWGKIREDGPRLLGAEVGEDERRWATIIRSLLVQLSGRRSGLLRHQHSTFVCCIFTRPELYKSNCRGPSSVFHQSNLLRPPLLFCSFTSAVAAAAPCCCPCCCHSLRCSCWDLLLCCPIGITKGQMPLHYTNYKIGVA